MYTILIVDDEANLLEVLAVALENMGYGCNAPDNFVYNAV